MKHDFTNAAGYRGFGPRWSLPEPSKGQERQVVHWCATDEAKALPNPLIQKRADFAAQIGDDEKAFWQEMRKEFGAMFYDGDQERSNEPDRRKRGI